METVLQYITLYAPIIVAILSEIGVVFGLIKKVREYFTQAKSAVDELKESQEYRDLKAQMKIINEENIKLKKALNAVLEKLTHVKVVEDEEISNN